MIFFKWKVLEEYQVAFFSVAPGSCQVEGQAEHLTTDGGRGCWGGINPEEGLGETQASWPHEAAPAPRQVSVGAPGNHTVPGKVHLEIHSILILSTRSEDRPCGLSHLAL